MTGGPTASRPVKPSRILVVEDQDSIRQFVQAVLAGAGHEVVVALNGAEAVAAVRDAAFDLVLMDVNMPIMNGLTAAREIRALEGVRSKIPIIAITGDEQLALDAVMSDHICKPFKKVALLLKVDAWLRGDLPSSQAEASEGTSFEEACELMGRPWAVRGLMRLNVQIDETFGADPETAQDCEQLADQAHALVSLAAILGFSTLSDLCSTLEEECRRGLDVQATFAIARAEASKVRRSASDLVAASELDGHDDGAAGGPVGYGSGGRRP